MASMWNSFIGKICLSQYIKGLSPMISIYNEPDDHFEAAFPIKFTASKSWR